MNATDEGRSLIARILKSHSENKFTIEHATDLDRILDNDYIPEGEDPETFKAHITIRQYLRSLPWVKDVVRNSSLGDGQFFFREESKTGNETPAQAAKRGFYSGPKH